MPKLSLRDPDARLLYLATVYHLGRPGSETDAMTLERHDLGLGPVHEALAPQMGREVVEVEVSPYQVHRIGEALLGIINELKQYEMAHGRSAVPRFEATVRRLFPEVSTEPGAALELVREAMMLRRRLGGAIAQADQALAEARGEPSARPDGERRPWWRVWRR